MKKLILALLVTCMFTAAKAQSPIGKWKRLSSTVVFNGQKMDMHEALLAQRPCAAGIVYEINADKTYRLNASASGCDQKYRDIQEKLWSKSKWKLEGDILTISATNFAVGHSYKVSFSGNKMTMTGTDGEGVTVYQLISIKK